MDLGFTESDADAQDGAFTFGVDAQGDQDGAIQEVAPVPDLFVAGIEHQVGKGRERAGAPGLELGIEFGGALTDQKVEWTQFGGEHMFAESMRQAMSSGAQLDSTIKLIQNIPTYAVKCLKCGKYDLFSRLDRKS